MLPVYNALLCNVMPSLTLHHLHNVVSAKACRTARQQAQQQQGGRVKHPRWAGEAICGDGRVHVHCTEHLSIPRMLEPFSSHL